MKLVIAGSRTIVNYNDIEEWMNFIEIDKQCFDRKNITEVVSGVAKGTDLNGEVWADKNHIFVKQFPANWTKYGKSAGPIRNKEMAQYCDAAVIFQDLRTLKSNGSRNMLEQMKRLCPNQVECKTFFKTMKSFIEVDNEGNRILQYCLLYYFDKTLERKLMNEVSLDEIS